LALHNQQFLLPLLVRFDLNLKVILHECGPFVAGFKFLLQLGNFELQLLHLKFLIQITSALSVLQLLDLLSQLNDYCTLLRVLFLPNLVRFFMINFDFVCHWGHRADQLRKWLYFSGYRG
jgi:hypothetical protein